MFRFGFGVATGIILALGGLIVGIATAVEYSESIGKALEKRWPETFVPNEDTNVKDDDQEQATGEGPPLSAA